MSEKMFNTRIIHKHDTAENWEKATGFIPKSGELIVYDPDENFSYARTKIGDGATPVTELPFTEVQADWNQYDESAPDYIKNKPFGETPTGGDTLLWDGDTTNKTVVDVQGDGSFLFVKVSELTPPFELMQYGCTVGMMGQKNEVEFTQDQYGQISIEKSPYLFVIPRDATQEEIEQGAIFKEKGVYFLKAGEIFVESLTIPGYTEFPGVAKIDKKYLPDYDFAGKKVENKEFEINGETVIANYGAEIFNDYFANKATGFYSHAEGIDTIASGNYSHAENFETVASGANSHAENYKAVASGESSHAEGHYTEASGAYSHAEGLQTEARGSASHAEGNSTIAENAFTHVEGSYNLLLNPPIEEQVTENVRFGGGTPLYVCSEQPTIDNDLKQYTASSIEYVETENIQVGDYVTSHAFDYETYYKVTSINGGWLYGEEHKLIIPSREKGKYAHILGNGTPNNRSNAHTIDWEGNAWFQGDVYVSSTSGIDKDEGSKKLATEEYVTTKLSQEIYKQPEEPTDAPEGALWVDTDEESGSGGSGGGVSSWNDLTDKPFEEIVTISDTLTWDGNTSGLVSLVTWPHFKVSDNVPTEEDLANGYEITLSSGATITSTEFPLSTNEEGDIYLGNGAGPGIPLVVIVQNDKTSTPTPIPIQKGIYFIALVPYVESLTIPGYTFENKVIKTIEPKYMPKHLQLKESIVVTDTLTWDGNVSGLVSLEHWPHFKVSDNVPTAEDLANGYEITMSYNSTPITNVEAPLFTDEEGAIYLGKNHGPSYGVPLAIIVPNDETSFGQKGIYLTNFMAVYVESLKIPGYTFVIKETKLDKKYIPDTMPEVTTEDNGKILRVVDGVWVAASIPTAEEVGALTEAQVTTMINNALGVIENGAY